MIPSVSDVKEKQGTKLLAEKSKLGLILTKKVSSIARKRDYYSFIISDVSRYDMDGTLAIDNESKSYRIKAIKKEDYKKGDILLVKAEFGRYKKTIYPVDTILVKED